MSAVDDADMYTKRAMSVKVAIGVIGGSALVGVAAVCAGVLAGSSQTTTANTTLISDTTTTTAITVAVPGITGKAPLFAGQNPNSNPQG
ncbi:hypothetical protein BOO86_20770 [Mycobacterium sp. CBMA 234]|uniref:hypothetical protein n=1 Tax=Mycolicibacterium sp. CBMA 234 TaxID=1918495 RepID=UPI0012DDB8F2|nr:hypothetical protein [Mycolicibacterium sp. CBMA 234]MUL66921.1 hypothetical protein [Mycolicibacterium sp. CBMA 234]